MNQRGNEPMVMLHAYIPTKVMEKLESDAAQCGLSKSEYIRRILQFCIDHNIAIKQEITGRI